MEQKLTKEEIAKVFAMYLGCEVTDATFVGTSGDDVRNGYLTGLKQGNGFLELEVQLHDELHADEEPTYVDSTEMQLRLKLPSSISDEDAIEVADIAKYKSEEYFQKQYGHSRLEHVKNVIKEGYFGFADFEKCIEIIDFLRSKGYALPYKGQSLFDLGIAIDSTLNNNK